MVLVLAVTCIILGGNQYVGNTINCFLTPEFNGAQTEYVNQFCWTSSTYQIYSDPDDPHDPFRSYPGEKKNGEEITFGSSGEKRFVSYYQWVPIFLVIQAVSFYIPYLVWRNLSKMSGMHLPNFMKGVYELAKVQSNDSARNFLLQDSVVLFSQFLDLKKRTERKQKLLPNFLVFSYFFSKSLYLANVIFQLIALHTFLRTEIISHSFKVIKKMLFERDWTSSVRFPIRTICEFKGNPQMNNYLVSHTTHCVLPNNLYNDKIYAVIAFLLLTLTVLSVIGIMIWIVTIFYPKEKVVLDQLKAHGVNTESQIVNDFIHNHLGRDGRFIVQLIDRNIGRVTVAAVVVALWDKYRLDAAGVEESDSLDSVSYSSNEAEERRTLYPALKRKKKPSAPPAPGKKGSGSLKPLRCENCLTEVAGDQEGGFCPKCGQIIDY